MKPLRRELSGQGIFVPAQTLADGSAWPVVLYGVASVALFAVIGIGLSALLGRWWAVMAAAIVPACGSLAFFLTCEDFIVAGDDPAPNCAHGGEQ